MNLQEWINYHKNCPLCQAPLTTYFHSSRRQSIKWEEGRMVVVFPLRSEGKKLKLMLTTNYNVGYSFNLSDNQFQIEFYSKDSSMRLENVPFHLLDKFKTLNTNLKSYRFYRQCNGCQRYHYSSGPFKLDLPTSTLRFKDDLFVSSEFFGLIQATEKGAKAPYRIYRLLNVYSVHDTVRDGDYSKQGSHLTYWYSTTPQGTMSDQTVPNEATYLDLPLIPFVSPDDTLSRIQKLLVFS